MPIFIKRIGCDAMKYLQKKIRIQKPDGSFVRKTVYGHSEEELKLKIEQAREKAEKELERALNPTFGDVADEWNESHEKEVSHYTYDGYQAPLKNLKDEFENVLIKDIAPLDLQRFINSLGKKGYAKHTIAMRKIVASQIFDYAVVKGFIKINPITTVKIPKNAPKKPRELPRDDDIETVKQSVDLPFGLFAYLVLYTGCRRGEALALTYEDIDFMNNTISINKVVVFEYGKPKIYHRAKSQDGIRTIPLLTPLRNVLSNKKKGFVFHVDDQPLTLSQFNIFWRKYKKETGINLSPHQLRHAFATICFDAGLTPKDASQILGHSKIELTLDIYTHIKQSRTQETANKLNDYLNKIS